MGDAGGDSEGGDGSVAAATRPRLYAHRGSTVLAPENSAPAFDLALYHGADVLEIDVRLDRHDTLWVFHDASLERTTDGSGALRALDGRRIAALDAGCRHAHADGSSWTGERASPLSLDMFLERYRGVAVNIDLKDDDVQAARALHATLVRHDRRAGLTVGSFHPRVIAAFRRLAPDHATAAGRLEVAGLYFGRHLRRAVAAASMRPPSRPYRALQIPPRFGPFDLASEAFARHARALDLELVYWTINDAERMRRLAARGATGIVTDRIDIAAATFGVPRRAAFRP